MIPPRKSPYPLARKRVNRLFSIEGKPKGAARYEPPRWTRKARAGASAVQVLEWQAGKSFASGRVRAESSLTDSVGTATAKGKQTLALTRRPANRQGLAGSQQNRLPIRGSEKKGVAFLPRLKALGLSCHKRYERKRSFERRNC